MPIVPVSVLPASLVNSASRCGSGTWSHIGVRIAPGRTALTRTGASSTASPRASPSMAAAPLAASAAPGTGRTPTVPEVSTIEPPGRRRGGACLTAVTAPQNRTSNTCLASSGGTSRSGRGLAASPAVYTRWSSSPTSANRADMSVSLRVSATNPVQPSGSPASAASSRSREPEAIVTAAPAAAAARAVASPIPELPPMMTTR